MKRTIKGYVVGFATAILLLVLATGVYAAVRTATITVTYNNIRLVVNGELITPRDGAGNIVEPFIYNGTTFLPVRAVADALGQEVRWDGNTNTVYISAPTPPAPQTRDVPLFNMPHSSVGNVNLFSATGNAYENRILLKISQANFDYAGEPIANNRFRYSNYVVYQLNATATRLTATLHPATGGGRPETTYTISGDGRVLYTSQTMTENVAPIPINIDVSGVRELRIEVVFITGSHLGTGGIDFNTYRGIENATLTIIEPNPTSTNSPMTNTPTSPPTPNHNFNMNDPNVRAFPILAIATSAEELQLGTRIYQPHTFRGRQVDYIYTWQSAAEIIAVQQCDHSDSLIGDTTFYEWRMVPIKQWLDRQFAIWGRDMADIHQMTDYEKSYVIRDFTADERVMEEFIGLWRPSFRFTDGDCSPRAQAIHFLMIAMDFEMFQQVHTYVNGVAHGSNAYWDSYAGLVRFVDAVGNGWNVWNLRIDELAENGFALWTP